MIVSRSLSSLAAALPLVLDEGCCVSIGNFDGVHKGHQALLALARARAEKRRLPVVTVTLEVLTPQRPPRLLPAADRAALLEAAGADLVLLLEFTPEMAAMPPEVFVRRILLERLGMRELFMGYDFTLGKGRTGTPEVLSRLGDACGFEVHRLEALSVDGEVVSSTRIREYVRQGDVWKAAGMLGRLHAARGLVVHGRHRGTGMGFPTANLGPVETLLPKPGVYAPLATLAEDSATGAGLPPPGLSMQRPESGRVFPAVTNIGHNPTFGPAALSVETHILDLHRDLYGQPLEVAFLERLRGEVTFTGPEALAAQIRKDTGEARTLFANMAG